ncbi:DNA oxidative demethylase AlkB [Pseudidiomarina sediminum]|uniref:DNA oxidative demethylase AlkB n=1 Tax=Pseudidiomarina sediminum TaxID=431675 RepID=A0A432Z355_9GAMM|nr:DNA oxidative demethylase AlkB [Pseudidiomarina sediminum]RUO72328.1 DNA oxidative demethylase AlkB [Pseudidiomarina sediminum]
MQHDLFTTNDAPEPISIGADALLLPQFLSAYEQQLVRAIDTIIARAPWRQLTTPGGRKLSVRTSNCGKYGWYSDRAGYRYVACDPLTGQAWPQLPQVFVEQAQAAAEEAGFADFQPDACLLNCYQPGVKMGLHQDCDEEDLSAPIVSFSLGLPAQFLWGGWQRSDKVQRIRLQHGDVVVWGGEDRLRFHGIAKVAGGNHPLLGGQRINLTFRQAKR